MQSHLLAARVRAAGLWPATGGAGRGSPAPTAPTGDPLERARLLALEDIEMLQQQHGSRPKRDTLLQGREEFV